jgi:hypothetical protein
LNGITSIPNFMKIYRVIQKLLLEDTHTDRQIDRHRALQTGDLISLLSFLVSRLKISYESMDFNRLVQNTIQMKYFVNMVVNFGVP